MNPPIPKGWEEIPEHEHHTQFDRFWIEDPGKWVDALFRGPNLFGHVFIRKIPTKKQGSK